MAAPRLLGLHHVTAIATDPQDSLDFYLDVLGLTLVKRTVNFDDPGTYHLYFGDADATPGCILTFFPWPGAHRGRVGNGQVATTAFAAPRGSFFYWHDRLLEARHRGHQARRAVRRPGSGLRRPRRSATGNCGDDERSAPGRRRARCPNPSRSRDFTAPRSRKRATSAPRRCCRTSWA